MKIVAYLRLKVVCKGFFTGGFGHDFHNDFNTLEADFGFDKLVAKLKSGLE